MKIRRLKESIKENTDYDNVMSGEDIFNWALDDEYVCQDIENYYQTRIENVDYYDIISYVVKNKEQYPELQEYSLKIDESLNEDVSKDRHGIIKLAKEIADEIDSYTNLGRVFSIADTVILSDLGAIIRVLDNNNFVYADDNFTHNYSDVYDILYDIFGEEDEEE